MANPVTRLSDLIAKEPLSIQLIFLAITLNFWAWVIPRGDYRHPARDPLGAAQWVSEKFTDISSLHYFWNAVLAVTVLAVGYSAYNLSAMALTFLGDKVDL